MKKALVRRKRHQLPMLSVLIRYQIGRADQYGRGRWITEADLPLIKAGMEADPSKITNVGGMPCLLVNGSNRHNQVEMADFAELFTSEGGAL